MFTGTWTPLDNATESDKMPPVEHSCHASMRNSRWPCYPDRFMFSLHLLAISRALCQHSAGSHPDQGQLCGAGGHCGHQGHLSQIPQQVGFLFGKGVLMHTLFCEKQESS